MFDRLSREYFFFISFLCLFFGLLSYSLVYVEDIDEEIIHENTINYQTTPADTLEAITNDEINTIESLIFLENAETLIDTTLVLATETTIWDSLYYEADFLHYFVDLDKILLTGNAQVRYHTSTIKADSISIDFERNQAVATGHVIMEDIDQLIIGQTAFFDIETEVGIVFEGASSFNQGFYYGEEIRKVGENVYDLDQGRFTTCEALHPHFDIRSWSMRLYHDNVIIGRPIIFYVNDFPLIPLPFAAFSVKSGRSSGFLMPSPGYSSRTGKKIEDIAYFYVINDYADVLFKADFLEKKGINFLINFDYHDRYRYNGNLKTTYKFINDIEHEVNPDSYRHEWNINYRHFHRLPERATFDVTIDYSSSRDVWYDEIDPKIRLQENMRSSISWRKPLRSSSFLAAASYQENLISNQKNIVLPNISYSLPSRPVHELIPFISDEVRRQDHWWKTFSMNWSMAGVHQGQITDDDPTFAQVIWQNKMDDEGNYLSQHHAGIRQNIALSWNYTAFGWLRLSSSVNYQDALMDRDREGNVLVHGYSYGSTSSASFNVFGMKRYNSGPILAARHIVTPSASFRYSPDFSDNSRFYSFSGIGVSQARKARNLNLSLDQRWQFRLVPDSNGMERRLNDLFTLRSSSAYNFENKTRPWSDLNHSFSINPGSYELIGVNFGLNQSMTTTQRVYEDFEFSSWRSSTRLSFSGNANYFDYFPLQKNDFITNNLFRPETPVEENMNIMTIDDFERLFNPAGWSLSTTFDYNYDRRSRRKTQNLNTDASFRVTQNWSMTYYNYFDFTTMSMRGQRIGLIRSFDCWNITLDYRQTGNAWQLSLLFANIRLHDLRLPYNTSS
ncbi:MAG: hypothetical protein FWG98_05770 [Candidatus Cloacimonetes bacterium]|nr:hypothetical protein [Candidatus Cloacimonadota bacterium]